MTPHSEHPNETAADAPEGITIHPLVVQGTEAFYRDLPELLKTHYWQWVAYSGDRRLGFGRTQTDLYQRCVRQGHKPGEFVVMSIDYGSLHDNDEMDPPSGA
jgi:hypothetical protein